MDPRDLHGDTGADAGGARVRARRERGNLLRGQRLGVGTILAVTFVVGFVVWFGLELGGNGDTPTPQATAPAVARTVGPVAATPAQLGTLTSPLGHTVYWAGPRPNMTYELTISSSGQTDIRYLPKGVAVGTTSGAYLTIATYQVSDAYSVTSAISGSNIVTVDIPNHGIAKYQSSNPSDIHLAYSGSDAQVEVFDPSPGAARTLVTSGAILPVQ
jgi:hypothetical protein